MIVRGADRYRTVQPGIETWHEFSAGPHYDPANLAFGSLIGVDEHRLAPGARFERHAHRGVEIVSYVIDGALDHDGTRVTGLLRQVAGDGIEHVEGNASQTEPLVLLQFTFLGAPGLPVRLRDCPTELTAPSYVHVLTGTHAGLATGDSIRATEDVALRGTGQILVVEF